LKSERQYREEIVRFGRMLYERGFIAAKDGNLSVRLDDDTILVTCAGLCKGTLSADDMVLVDPDGRRKSGDRAVSTEMGMHLLIYHERPDVHAIVHAHPPTATGFAVAGMALDKPILAEVIVTLGSVPLARYGTPGTPELADSLSPLVPHHDAILMANHGVVAYGHDLERAYMNMEIVEHAAKIALVTHQLGREQMLPEEAVRKLNAQRAEYNRAAQAAAAEAHRATGTSKRPQ